MKVTVKGQVTIPEDVRRRHGFLPGTEVRFVEEDGAVRIVKAEGRQARGLELVKRMRGKATTRLTTDEIMALTRGEP